MVDVILQAGTCRLNDGGVVFGIVLGVGCWVLVAHSSVDPILSFGFSSAQYWTLWSGPFYIQYPYH